MAEKSRTRLLEVTVANRSRYSWEWQVRNGDEVLVCGFEATRLGARFAGNDAMFLILASGWQGIASPGG